MIHCIMCIKNILTIWLQSGCSPWLQDLNWHQSNVGSYTLSNHENVGISTYMEISSEGNSTIFGNGNPQPPQT